MKQLQSQLFNWKTTIAGISAAVILPLLDLYAKGTVDNKTLIISALALFFGWVSKDA